MFELRECDLAGRIGRLSTAHGVIETPAIFPVINPNHQLVPAARLKKLGADCVITNAYLLWKDFFQDVIDKGVHDFLGFDGPVMTDSGAYQLMEFGDIEVSNKEIIGFQKKIGVDIGVVLDVPTASFDRAKIKQSVDLTLSRAKEARTLIKKPGMLWAGPIQGKTQPDLVKKCAEGMAKLGFGVFAVGSVVPLLSSYNFRPVVDAVVAAKEVLPANRPVHLFGAGHPMFFSFAVALGCDLFDSAAYALYAQDGRYMTISGTEHLEQMDYFPCSCPVCSKTTPAELRKESPEEKERLLAEHNLHVTFQELRTVKLAIKEKALWELMEQRAASHPALYACMKKISGLNDFLGKHDALTRQHVFETSEFSRLRPDVAAAKERAKNVHSKKIPISFYGQVSKNVAECFPFSQTVFAERTRVPRAPNSIEKLQDVSRYWFGTDIFGKKVRFEVSRHTGKIRAVYDKNGSLLAVVRPNDFLVLLHSGAKTLFKQSKRHRVVVRSDVQKFVLEGRTVFARHVKKCDPAVRPGSPVLVVGEKGKLLAAGESVLSATDMMRCDYGPAVSLRWVNK